MYRLLFALMTVTFTGIRLSAQAKPQKDSLTFNPVGTYRVEIFSPLPRGQWAGLIVITAGNGHYAGVFKSPDGPETYPVTSVAAAGDSLTITMGGEATGSTFSLAVKADSILGTMTSITNGLTQVRGLKLKQ